MQDPFDLLVIQNIIYDLQPDLIIETGTANGGSSLLWASVLEVLGLHNTRQARHRCGAASCAGDAALQACVTWAWCQGRAMVNGQKTCKVMPRRQGTL